jgi:DNA polymerase
MTHSARIPRVVYDTEFRSEIDLAERGLDNYANHPSTEPVFATVATDNFIFTAAFVDSSDGREALERELTRLGVCVVPPAVVLATLRAAEIVVASNVAFDQRMTAQKLGVHIPKERWSCTMARGMRHGLPGALENITQVLPVPECKDKEGHRLSKQLWQPRSTWRRKTPEAYAAKLADRIKRNAERALKGVKPLAPLAPYAEWRGPKWFEDAQRLARFGAYNAQDVRASRAVDKMLPELEPGEWEIWQHVWRMNERGIPLDMELVNGAIAINEQGIAELQERIRQYTNGEITTLRSTQQLTAWSEKCGYLIDTWTKDSVADALINPDIPEPLRVVAEARAMAARGSVSKYETAADQVSPDCRLRHQIVYAGTSTLRLAGRGVQPLNLFRPKIMADRKAGLADIQAGRPTRIPEWKLKYEPDRALAAIKSGSLAMLQEVGDTEEILADNIRSMIQAIAGYKIASPDLSAIEARGVFWISDCETALVIYRQGGDLYCVTASNILGFEVNANDHPELRQNYGKVPVLSCGYGAGPDTVALKNRIAIEIAQKSVYGYRDMFPEVKRNGWVPLENAAIDAVRNPGYVFSCCRGRVSFLFNGGWLQLRRPSGVVMWLPDAGIDAEGRLFYHTWTKGFWRPESVWGGVLMNFVIQGAMRDLMYEAELKIARDPRYELFLQCYDSLSALVHNDDAEELCNEMIAIMTTPPRWAPDLPLKAEGKPKLRYA